MSVGELKNLKSLQQLNLYANPDLPLESVNTLQEALRSFDPEKELPILTKPPRAVQTGNPNQVPSLI